MTTSTESTEPGAPAGPVGTLTGGFRVLPPIAWHRAWRVVERNARAYRRLWLVFVAGLVEPMLFLFSIGIGVGALVGELPGPSGELVSYEVFIAPGLLAAAAMNGAIFDATFNFFIKFKYLHTYDGMLSSPLTPADAATGEILWGLTRGTFYSGCFLLTMAVLGFTESWWAIAALPVTVLVGGAFASLGLAAATFMRSFVDFDYVNMAIIPLFLFSATFFPLQRYPDGVRVVIEWTPLYQGVELCRALTLGQLDPSLLVNLLYLLVMATLGIAVASRRLGALLQP